MERNGVICLGEALIDFIPLDQKNETYQRNPGGAPANVAVGLAKLGIDVNFVGKVGNDTLGRFLQKTLATYGVDVSKLSFSKDVRTGIVLVTLAEHGERSFEFFVNPSADSCLTVEDVPDCLFEQKKILHAGSISLIHDPAKRATWKAIKLAKQHGMLFSFDPNIRMSLWSNEKIAKDTIHSVLPYVDILKLSEDELFFLTLKHGMEAIETLAQTYGTPLIFVTMGERGSIAYFKGLSVQSKAMPVQALDTTGAGDAFVSAVLCQINKRKQGILEISRDELKEMGNVASISGALAASAKGAMSALPNLTQINHYQRQQLD